jgi:Fic family protein
MYSPDTLCNREIMLLAETAADISDAERAVIELNNSSQTLSNTEALARLLLRAEALSSSRIEGLVIGARRILKAELTDDHRDITAQEVISNINAMVMALDKAEHGSVSLETIQEIHRSLMQNAHLAEHAGRIRTEQNWLGGNAYNPVGAAFVPPSADLVRPLLKDLVRFINDDSLPPLAQAAIAHAQFETIHPFVDGNGRTGRTLIHLILRKRGLCPRVVPPVSLVLATMAREYAKELMLFRYSGEPNGDTALQSLNSWMSFFADCTLRASRDAVLFEQRIADLKKEWAERLDAKATATSKLMLDAIVGQPLFVAKDMVSALGKSLPTINATIGRLVEAEIVKQVNAGKRNRVFEATEVLSIFTGFERSLASPANDTAIEKPARPVPFPM